MPPHTVPSMKVRQVFETSQRDPRYPILQTLKASQGLLHAVMLLTSDMHRMGVSWSVTGYVPHITQVPEGGASPECSLLVPAVAHASTWFLDSGICSCHLPTF